MSVLSLDATNGFQVAGDSYITGRLVVNEILLGPGGTGSTGTLLGGSGAQGYQGPGGIGATFANVFSYDGSTGLQINSNSYIAGRLAVDELLLGPGVTGGQGTTVVGIAGAQGRQGPAGAGSPFLGTFSYGGSTGLQINSDSYIAGRLFVDEILLGPGGTGSTGGTVITGAAGTQGFQGSAPYMDVLSYGSTYGFQVNSDSYITGRLIVNEILLGPGSTGSTGGTVITGALGGQGFQGPAGGGGGGSGSQGFQGSLSNELSEDVTFASSDLSFGSTAAPLGTLYTQRLVGVQSEIGLTNTSAFVTGNVVPTDDSVYDLGSPDLKWRSLYVSSNTINIGETAVSVNTDPAASSLLSIATGTATVNVVNTSADSNQIPANLVPFSSFSFGFTVTYSDGDTADWTDQIYSMISTQSIAYDGLTTPSLPTGSTALDIATTKAALNGAYYILQFTEGVSDPSCSLNIPVLEFAVTGDNFTFETVTSTDNYTTFYEGDVALFNISLNTDGTLLRAGFVRVSFNIPVGTIGSAKLASLSIVSNKIATSAITTTKIADLNVTSDKIANDAITTQKIEDGAITVSKIDSSVLTALATAGAQGAQGAAGANGATGASGTQGSQGRQGAGTQGAQGAAGATGAGVQGAQGGVGVQGPAGSGGTGGGGTSLGTYQSSKNTLLYTAFGPPVFSTGQVLFPATSSTSLLIAADTSTNNSIVRVTNIDTSTYANNWTVEAFHYPTGAGNNQPTVFTLIGRTNLVYMYVRLFNNGLVNLTLSADGTTNFINGVSSTLTVARNQWIHIAVTYNGTAYRVFINGVEYISRTNATVLPAVAFQTLALGNRGNANEVSAGYMSEVRVSTVARYTSAFTPTTTKFTSDANTIFLNHLDGPNGTQYYDWSQETPSVTITSNVQFQGGILTLGRVMAVATEKATLSAPASQIVSTNGTANIITWTAFGSYRSTIGTFNDGFLRNWSDSNIYFPSSGVYSIMFISTSSGTGNAVVNFRRGATNLESPLMSSFLYSGVASGFPINFQRILYIDSTEILTVNVRTTANLWTTMYMEIYRLV
jgi:hypothetical protein